MVDSISSKIETAGSANRLASEAESSPSHFAGADNWSAARRYERQHRNA